MILIIKTYNNTYFKVEGVNKILNQNHLGYLEVTFWDA